MEIKCYLRSLYNIILQVCQMPVFPLQFYHYHLVEKNLPALPYRQVQCVYKDTFSLIMKTHTPVFIIYCTNTETKQLKRALTIVYVLYVCFICNFFRFNDRWTLRVYMIKILTSRINDYLRQDIKRIVFP